MNLIETNDGYFTIEITSRCYTSCEYCYKRHNVSPRGTHVPYELIRDRVLWIKENTDAIGVYIIGGESLLHPNYKMICDLIISLGLKLATVTSFQISKNGVEIDNLLYLFELYRKGLVFIEGSLHLGRNEKNFTMAVDKLNGLYQERRKSLQERGIKEQFDFHVNLVFPAHISFEDMIAGYKKLLKIFNWKYQESSAKNMAEFYEHNIVTRKNSIAHSTWSTEDWQGFRVKTKIIVESQFADQKGRVEVKAIEGGMCPAIKSDFSSNKIALEDPLIRTDGALTFSHVQCIDMANPLLYIDNYTSQRKLQSNLRKSLLQIHRHVFLYNRIKARENCDENGNEQECHHCPLDRMCTPCWYTERPYQLKTPQ